MAGSSREEHQFVLATANPDKAREIATVLTAEHLDIELVARPVGVAEVPEDGETLEANARLKAEALCRATGMPVIADDTGLEVDVLGGAPGVHSARYAGEDATYARNCEKLLDALEGVPLERRTARFRTVAVARWPDGREVVREGTVEGLITETPRGEQGFGYDPVFVPLPSREDTGSLARAHGEPRTFAEMSPEEKHERSHRGAAFRSLAQALRAVPSEGSGAWDEASIDPDVRTLLEVVAANPSTWDDDTDVEETRAGLVLLMTAGTGCRDIAQVHDVAVQRSTGSGGDLALRIYRPSGESEAGGVPGALVWFHGGGFVLGSIESHDGLCRLLADRVGCAVVGVDYRLAPEHVFPAAQEDALAAWRWVTEHLEGRPVAVGGDSAGGSLAAHVAIEARGGPASPAALLMACPLTDLSDALNDAPSASMREKADGYLLTAQAMRWFAHRFLPDGVDPGDPRVSVLHAPDLGGLPPTLVVTAEHDPLRDQGEAFAARLADAGVDVTTSRYKGTVHAFFGLVEVLESGRRSLDEAARLLRSRLGA